MIGNYNTAPMHNKPRRTRSNSVYWRRFSFASRNMMVRTLVLVLGILVIAVGGIGLVADVLSASTAGVSLASATPDAAQFCNPGETLATEQGPESYNDEDGIYSRHTIFNCVNAAGIKRDVTNKVAENAINGLVSGIAAALTLVISLVVVAIGVLLLAYALIPRRPRPITNPG